MTQTLYTTDHELRAAIADEVGVALNSGAVTPSGQMEIYLEKYEAVRAAMRVREVTAVADEIVVRNGWAPRKGTDIAVGVTEVTIPTGSVQY